MQFSKKDFYECFGFGPTDMLLPKDGIDPEKWSVIAVDQHTSEGEYWENLKAHIGNSPSTLNMVLPEYFLEKEDVADRYRSINQTMRQYLEENIFKELKNSFVYIEREQTGGGVRRGLLGAVDLEKYDFTPGSGSMIRSTEETVTTRIPPRVQIRKDATVELPHILILCDDPEDVLMKRAYMERKEKLYDFHVSGSNQRLTGWRVPGECDAFFKCLDKLNTEKETSFLFAVGDGNHSLATAKAVYEEKKAQNVPSSEIEMARYALCELVNIRESGMPFLPIHRLMTENIEEIKCKAKALDGEKEYTFTAYHEGKKEIITVKDQNDLMPVAVMQRFIDRFQIPVDYIHDDETLIKLAGEKGYTGILLPAPQRELLFKTVETLGVLPRKTFSLGAAADKRYYYEGRKIKE